MAHTDRQMNTPFFIAGFVGVASSSGEALAAEVEPDLSPGSVIPVTHPSTYSRCYESEADNFQIYLPPTPSFGRVLLRLFVRQIRCDAVEFNRAPLA